MGQKCPILCCILMTESDKYFCRKGTINMKKWVLIADADEQFRNELAEALESSEEFTVMGVAADGEEALQMLHTKQADILIMDLLLPKIDGLTVLEHVRNLWYRPKVLITSAFISQYVAVTAMRMGAQELLPKPCSVDSVVKNLQRMENGEAGGPVIFLWNGEQTVETLVTSILHEIGVPANIKGYLYLREAIVLAVNDKDKNNAILKNRYDEVAGIFDTTAERVEHAIRHAVEVAWDRGDLDTLQRFFAYTVSNTKGKPTNSEFIAIVADQIRLWMKRNGDRLN